MMTAMLDIQRTTKFKKDFKRMQKRGVNTRVFDEVVTQLVMGKPLSVKYHDHALSNNWIGHRECHLAPDWLLIYRVMGNTLQLVRMGSHADLFE